MQRPGEAHRHQAGSSSRAPAPRGDHGGAREGQRDERRRRRRRRASHRRRPPPGSRRRRALAAARRSHRRRPSSSASGGRRARLVVVVLVRAVVVAVVDVSAGPRLPCVVGRRRSPWSAGPADRCRCVVGVVGGRVGRRGRRRRGRRHPRLGHVVAERPALDAARRRHAAAGARRAVGPRSAPRGVPVGPVALGGGRAVAGVGGRLAVDPAEQARELRGACEGEARARRARRSPIARAGARTAPARRRRTRTKSTTTVMPVASVQAPARTAGGRRRRRRPTARSTEPSATSPPTRARAARRVRLAIRSPAPARAGDGSPQGARRRAARSARPDQRELAGGRAGRRQLAAAPGTGAGATTSISTVTVDARGLPDQRRRCASPARRPPGSRRCLDRAGGVGRGRAQGDGRGVRVTSTVSRARSPPRRS